MIKFRTWDDESGHYRYFDIFGAFDALKKDMRPSTINSVAMQITNPKWVQDESLILEQYTGMEDIDGREIYEGDIVEKIQDVDYNGVWWHEIGSIKHVKITTTGVFPCAEYDSGNGTCESGKNWRVIKNKEI